MKCFLSDESNVKILSQTLQQWVPNLWTSEIPLVNIATGKEAPQEMVKNLKSLKQIGENAMNESMIALKHRKLYHLSQPVTRKCQQLQKMKINLSVKFLHASIIKRSVCAR